MAKIKIQNIGPIVDVEMEINKVNVIMGPQSSGKSTIAKLISYCQWVEKRYMLDGEYKEDVRKQLLRFHRLNETYFRENSYFEYDSEFIKISYSGKGLKESIIVNEDKILEYKKTKNIYIPAERNFVSAIPNLKKYNETNDNILGFIYDWFTAKRPYTKQNTLPILNLNVNYYYIEGLDLDMLVLDNGKEIPLSTASSGLQSITPLFVVLESLTRNIYKEETPLSITENDYLNKLLKPISAENSLNELKNKRILYHGTNFIIEEPEQNLFPITQRDLIYDIFKRLDSEKEHSLLLTTHSPYILYAINNCLLGGLVTSQLEGAEKEEFLSESFLSQKSWINPELVSVWEIENGKLRQIQDKDNIVSQNYFDAKMTELVDEYYLILNYYKDEDER